MTTLCLLMVGAINEFAADDFPRKPIRIVVPYPPGATPDRLPRIVAPKVAEVLGQPVIVENRPGGAGGDVGAAYVAQAAPDGYTLLLISNANTASAATKRRPAFDVAKDFKAVLLFGSQPMYPVAATDFPANNIAELSKLAKSTPQGLNYGTIGHGTPQHLVTELLLHNQQIKMLQIPFKGAAQALQETVAGRVSVTWGGPLSAGAFIADNRLKVLAVTAPARLSYLPKVPTFGEAGVPGFETEFWYGLAAPSGTPQEVADKIIAALSTVLEMPEVKAQIDNLRVEGTRFTGSQFADFMAADVRKWKRAADDASIVTDRPFDKTSGARQRS